MKKVKNVEKTLGDLNKKGESDRLDQLDKVVQALTAKVLSLGGVIKDMEKKPDTDKNVLNKNCITEKSS